MTAHRSKLAIDTGTPFLSVSDTDMRANRTGTWRHLTPVYEAAEAPCSHTCPAGNQVREFVRAAAQGDLAGAREILLRTNPLFGVTGRVCFRPCEEACSRSGFDAPVSIQEIERAVFDHLDRPREAPFPPPPPAGEPVAVIGSGPAGLACAYQLACRGIRPTVFEARQVLGGILRVGIPDYRLPPEVLDAEIDFICRCGVELRTGMRLGKNLSLDDLHPFRAVFLATGAHRSVPLGIEGEDGGSVMAGLALLERVNLGDRPHLGRRVAVIGGGNTAMDAARTAVRLGAAATVVYRRTEVEMPAHAEEIRAAREEGVRLLFLAAPTRIERSPEGRVVRLHLARTELGERDSSGRRRPVEVPGSGFSLGTDFVVTALGERGALDFLPGEVKRTRWGTVVVDEWGRAEGGGGRGDEGRLPAVFAGGDAAGLERTVAHAIGSGNRAALAIEAYLRGEEIAVPPPPPAGRVVAADEVNPAYLPPGERRNGRRRARGGGEGGEALSFGEVKGGLTRSEAVAQAERCVSCGYCTRCDNCLLYCPDAGVLVDEEGYRIDYEHCKGCGICVVECPRGVLRFGGGGEGTP